MALIDLVNENHKTVRKALIGLWTLAVALYIADLTTSFPGIGITKTFVFMGAALLSSFAGMSQKVFSNSSDDDFLNFSEVEDAIEYVSPWSRLLKAALGMGLSVLFIGTLFKTMHWPGALVMLCFGCITSVIAGLICLTNKNTRKFAIATILTAALFGSISLTGLDIEIKFKDYPELVAAQKEYLNNLNSLEARAKLDYEAEKYKCSRSGLVLSQEIEEAYQQFLADPTDANYNNFSYAIFKFRR